LCLGLSADIEGEQGDAGNSEAAGDKIDLKLPGLQQRLMEMIVALGKPTVLCVLAGSALDLTWAQDHVPAIVYAWYPAARAAARWPTCCSATCRRRAGCRSRSRARWTTSPTSAATR
jgi:hypothetical protein